MSLPPDHLFRAVEATWPPRSLRSAGHAVLRDGAGGGKRVGAATLRPGWDGGDIDRIEAEMATPLVRVGGRDAKLDAALEARGYVRRDPTVIRACPIARLTDQAVPRVTAFTIWEPLAIMREIWAEGGIGPERVAVMTRAPGPKTAIFGRFEDAPAGAAFVAVAADVAVVHALEIRDSRRRRGLAGWMMRQAAIWGAAEGAAWLACCVTEANVPANAFYEGLGMGVSARYHYRQAGAA